MISTLTESRPPPPYSHRTRGYIILVPRYLNPLSREKGYTPYLWYWLPLTVTKSSRDYTAKNTPFPEKMGIRMRPPHAFEWEPGTEKHPLFRAFSGNLPETTAKYAPPPFSE